MLPVSTPEMSPGEVHHARFSYRASVHFSLWGMIRFLRVAAEKCCCAPGAPCRRVVVNVADENGLHMLRELAPGWRWHRHPVLRWPAGYS